MKIRLDAIAFLALAALASPALAQGSGARDRAMGGVGVASSHHSTAGFTNPALLSRAGKRDDFALVLPYFEAASEDQDQLRDALDAFQDTLDQVETLLEMGDFPGADALRPTLAQQLNELDGRTVEVGASTGIAVSLPSESLALAVIARAYVDAQAFPSIDPADTAVILDPLSTPTDLENLASEGVVIGTGVMEVGLTSSYAFELFGRPFSIGVTPKIQSIETFNYAAGISTFDGDNALDDLTDDTYRRDTMTVNVDAGVTFDPVPFLTIGIAGQDLVQQEIDTVMTSGRQFTYELGPRVVAGAAFRSEWLTVAADFDLLTKERFNRLDGTRFVRLGAELDAFGWLKVRAGVAHDLEETRTDVYSAGLGFAPFKTVNFDLVGAIGDNSAGAGVQLSLTL